MKSMTVLIPHNKLPYLHDTFTLQCKKICESLSKKINLKIVWVMFPSFPPHENSDFKSNNQEIIFSDQFDSILEIFKYVNPDLVLVNGSLDFHNVNTILMSRFKKIPVVTLFFRNIHLVTFSLSSILKVRIKNIFFKKKSKLSQSTLKQSPLEFFLSQANSLFKTAKIVNSTRFESIAFILNYIRIIFSNFFPVHKIISGDINLCSGEKLKKKLISSGFDNSSVFVVGDPSYDDLDLPIQNNQPKKSDKSKILFCPTPRHEQGFCSKKKEFDLIINVINKILDENDLEIALKLHPSSSSMKEYVDELEGKILKPIIFHQSEDLLQLLAQYDVLLTYGGTTAMTYASLLRKPSLNLDFDRNLTGIVFYNDDNVITQCRNLNSLVSDIKNVNCKAISEDDTKKFFENYFGFFDGKSSIRASDAIINFLKDIQN